MPPKGIVKLANNQANVFAGLMQLSSGLPIKSNARWKYKIRASVIVKQSFTFSYDFKFNNTTIDDYFFQNTSFVIIYIFFSL